MIIYSWHTSTNSALVSHQMLSGDILNAFTLEHTDRYTKSKFYIDASIRFLSSNKSPQLDILLFLQLHSNQEFQNC